MLHVPVIPFFTNMCESSYLNAFAVEGLDIHDDALIRKEILGSYNITIPESISLDNVIEKTNS